MNIDEIKFLADTIVGKKEKKEKLEKTKAVIDDRAEDGLILVNIPSLDKHATKETFWVDAEELKKVIDKEIAKQDSTADETALKQKAK